MSFFRSSVGAWALLGLAGCAWIGVIFFAWTIEADRTALATSQTSAHALEQQRNSATQLQSVARETKDARGQLDTLANVDVVSMVDTIDRVGKDAGVYIQIGQALPEAGKDTTAHVVTFQLAAEGSFASLFRAVALLQSIPIPTSLEQVQFMRTGATASTGSSWHMSARLRIISTADISS